MRHIMIDLETLGTKSDAIILSIGAIVFEPTLRPLFVDPPITDFYQNITLMDQILLGRTIDPDTVRFWREDASAEAVIALKHDQMLFALAITKFIGWINDVKSKGDKICVWANDPDFDCSILEHAFVQMNVNCPWTFRDKMAFRTLKNIDLLVRGTASALTTRKGVYHNALDDCYYQAEVVQILIESMKNGTAKA